MNREWDIVKSWRKWALDQGVASLGVNDGGVEDLQEFPDGRMQLVIGEKLKQSQEECETWRKWAVQILELAWGPDKEPKDPEALRKGIEHTIRYP
jgi:hypothetical protein